MDWIPSEPIWKWFFGALAAGFLCLMAAGVGGAIFAIRAYGFRGWLRSVFRIEPENFRIIGVLALLAVAMMLMYMRGAG